MIIILVSSAPSPREESNTLITSICITGAKIEASAFTTSIKHTGGGVVTRAADDYQEIKTPYPAKLDLLGAGVTRDHIGLPLASREIAGMVRLGSDVVGFQEWGWELLFVS
jgi:hypothetical protein